MNHRTLPNPQAFTNRYCTTCLQTRKFLDRSTHIVCETCSKRLDKVTPDLAVKR